MERDDAGQLQDDGLEDVSDEEEGSQEAQFSRYSENLEFQIDKICPDNLVGLASQGSGEVMCHFLHNKENY